MFQLDPTNAFHARVADRLKHEVVGWLTTVGANGVPQPNPVWFLWEDGTILIYSQPNTPKVRNVGRHPRVALNLNSGADGDNIVVLTGEARLDPATPPADRHPAYLAKYTGGIAAIGMTPASFAAAYSTAIRVTPAKLRGH